jgi:hypothetical protein
VAKASVAVAESVTPQPEPKLVAKPPPDPTGPIECSALVLPRPYGVNQTDNVIRVDSAVMTGIHVGGLCERIVLHPGGTFVVHVRHGVHRGIPELDRLKHRVQYLVFREGHGEALQ